MVFPVLTEYDYKLPYYVVGIACDYDNKYYKKEKGFPYYQWIQTRSGEGSVSFGNMGYHLSENSGILLLPNEPYELCRTAEHWKVDWIIFGGYGVESFFHTLKFEAMGVYYFPNPTTILYKMERILKLANSMYTLRGLDISCALYDFLVLLFKNTNFSINSLKMYPKLEGVYSYIDKHFNELIMLEDLSDIIGTSPQYLCKLFREVTGCRVVEYINNVRISKSKEIMFKHSNMKITEVAARCGFEESSYFCAVFKKFEGCTPREFKRRFVIQEL